MALNDTLTGEGATDWWRQEVQRILRLRRRDTKSDERAKTKDGWTDLRNDRSYCGVSDGIRYHPGPFLPLSLGVNQSDKKIAGRME